MAGLFEYSCQHIPYIVIHCEPFIGVLEGCHIPRCGMCCPEQEGTLQQVQTAVQAALMLRQYDLEDG